MLDQMRRNPGVITGTPTLVTGAITADSDQALSFNGTTNSMSVADSVSDSLVTATPGGMALELFAKFPSIPGVTKTVIGKAGSYVLEINSSGKLLWTLTGPSSSVTVTSTATIAPNSYYHIVGVWDGGYTGSPIFGYQTQGSVQMGIPGDYFQGSPTGDVNLQACKFTMLEKGQLTSVVMDLQRAPDGTLNEGIRAVVYGPNTSTVPGKKLGESADVVLSSYGARAWYTFPLDVAAAAGDIWLGFIAGESSGQFRIGRETTGGNRAWKNSSYSSDAPDPFGTPANVDLTKLSIYANYTPTGRTGSEGKALLYLNGVLDASSTYTDGVTDSANALSFAPSVAVTLDEPSIWNKKLTPVQVAQHYTASIASNPTGFPSGPPGGGGGPPAGLFTSETLLTSTTLVTA
jgi:hypothetical protein